MAGIGDSWGTREELLHPRGPDGKWIRKGGIAKSIIDGVLGFLAGFRPRTFQNRGQASQYLQNITHRQGARRMGRVDQVRLARDLGPANADLRDGVIDEPSTKRFVDMMDRSATELPDDAILTRIVGPDAFGFTPQTAQGTNSDTDPGIRGMSGKLIADRGYGLTSIGGVQGTPPAGSVRMVIAAKKGTKVTIPAASPSDTTVFLERGQPMRVTKVEPDGVGGWTMYVTAEPGGSGREVPESIAGPVGAGRESSKDREARIRDTMQSLAKLDKTPDEQKEQEDEAARAARAAEAAKVTPVPSPQQEAERRRLEVAQQQQAPRQPAPGEPPPRTEPVVGRVGEPGTGVPPQAAPAPGTPEPTTAPRRVVDIRTAVRDAGIPSPSSGPELRQWNEAYLGLKSGKTEPDEAARNLDANIRHNRGLAEDLRSRPGDEARIADLEENIKAQEALRDLIREQYDLPAPAAETPPAPTPVKKAPAAPAVKRTAGGLPKQEGLTPVKKATPRKSAADRDVAARDTAKSWLEAAGVSESDLGDMDRTGVAVVSDLVARRRISKAEAVRRLRTDREGSLLNRIADAIEASPRKKAAKKAAPAKKAPAKKAVPRPAAEKPGDDLDKMTKADLIAEAGRRGVTARQSWTKDRIKKAIRDREEAGAQAPEAPTPVKKATKKAAPALSDQETQIRELFEGDKPTVVQLREYARINGMEPSDAVVSQGFMKPLSRMKREELIGLILTGNESGRRFTGDRSVGRLPNASTLRQQIIATPEGNRGDMLDGVLAPLTQPQRRRLAKELGVRGQDRATNQGQILDAIREHFRGAVPEGAEAPAPVKKAAKAAVPGAAPGTAAGKITAGRLQVGNQVLVTQNNAGDWVPSTRKTGQTRLTIENIGRGEGRSGFRRTTTRLILTGRDENGNEIRVASVPGHQTFIVAPEPGAAPAKKAAKAAAPDREQAARDRQARIDRARSYGDVAAEIEELISGEVDNDVLVRGILRVGRGLPPEDLDQLVRAARSGNTNDVRLRMGNLLQAQGVNLFDRPGAIERFDRRRHELLGDDIPEGSMVHVVRPGVESTVDGEHLWLRKATVEVATPQETVREERAKRLVPEGSTQGARTDVPVDNALRKRELRKALMEADLPPASPGSARKAQQEIKDDLIGGRLTPEEAIRRLESEVEFLTEDANEVDANLRQTDLTDDERGKLLRHKAQLEASVESNKKHSEFLRKYFKGEGPVVSLEEMKEVDPEGFEFLKDATSDDMREAAKQAGLDAPSGDTPDEMFRDLIKQVAKKELDRRAAKKAAKKAPAKKAVKAVPEVPKERERIDVRLVGAGIDFDENDKWVKRILDDTQKDLDAGDKTPAAIGRELDEHATRRMTTAVYEHGAWHAESSLLTDEERAQRKAENQAEYDRVKAETTKIRELGKRLEKTRRRSVKKAAPAKAAPEVQAAEAKADDLEARLINDHLERVNKARSREQADRELDGLTLPELRRLATSMGERGRSKRELRDKILDRFFPETPTPVPGDRDAVARRLGIDPGESGAQGRLLDRVVDGEITEDQARQILSTSVAEQMGATGPQQGGNVLRQPNMPLSRRASGAGIQTPGRMFSDVDSAVTDADVRLRNGESHTDVARRLRERAARVAKADIMEEGRRFPTELDRDTLLSIRKSNADYLRRVATHVQQEGKATKAVPEVGAPSGSRTGTSPVGGTRPTLTVVRGDRDNREGTERRGRLTVVPPPKVEPARKPVPDDSSAQEAVPAGWDHRTKEAYGSKVPRLTDTLSRWVYSKERGKLQEDGTRANNTEPRINAALRGAIPMQEEIMQDIEALDEALRESRLQRDATVYRGYQHGIYILPDNWEQRDLTEFEWATPTYTATTQSREAAEDYTGDTSDRGFAIRMRIPKGFPALSIRDEPGGLDDEGEIILPRGLTYRVVADHGPTGQYGIRWLDVEPVLPEGGEPVRVPRGETMSSRQATLADITSGEEKERRRLGGGSSFTNLVTFDGGTAVHKDQSRSRAPKDEQKRVTDAEELGSLVADAVGLRAPATKRDGDTQIYLEHMPGKTGMEVMYDENTTPEKLLGRVVPTRSGRLLGLADALMLNGDRSTGNWLMDGDEIIPIDHGLSFAFTTPAGAAGSPFSRHLVRRRGDTGPAAFEYDWLEENDYHPEDMAIIRARLEALRAQFEALGQGNWWKAMMERFEILTKGAKGTERLL